jgi:hypothetical protein
MGQVVEHGLVNVLFMAGLSDPGFVHEYGTADRFFDEHFRHVMGRLIGAMRERVETPARLEPMFVAALRLRNFVVHGYFRERIELFGTQEGRQVMLSELADAVRQLRALDVELDDLVVTLGEPYGVTRERISEMLSQLRAGAQPFSG